MGYFGENDLYTADGHGHSTGQYAWKCIKMPPFGSEIPTAVLYRSVLIINDVVLNRYI